MRELNHTNCVRLKQGFFTQGDAEDEIFLNLAMDYVPETLKSVQLHYKERKELVPIFLTKLYMYQLLRGLAYIHGKGIVH